MEAARAAGRARNAEAPTDRDVRALLNGIRAGQGDARARLEAAVRDYPTPTRLALREIERDLLRDAERLDDRIRATFANPDDEPDELSVRDLEDVRERLRIIGRATKGARGMDIDPGLLFGIVFEALW